MKITLLYDLFKYLNKNDRIHWVLKLTHEGVDGGKYVFSSPIGEVILRK
jgi:hypothetical protein